MTDSRPEASRPTKGFVGYAADLEPEVYAFQREAYPARSPEAILPNWRWMFVESAARLGVAPLVWMYRRNSRVVAHQGAIPVRLKFGGRNLVTGWFVETMAANEVRGSPIGPMLVRKSLEELPCNLSLGQTEHMRALQFALGWHLVRTLPVFMLVVKHGFDLRNKLPPLVAEAAASLLALADRCAFERQRWRSRGSWSVALVERFGHEHDVLWQTMAEEVSCGVVRDAAYLTWKYRQRPTAAFTCLELRRDGEVAGIVVLMIREPDAVYRYRRGLIVDLVVRPSDDSATRRLLVESVRELRRLGAVSVVCFLAQPRLELCFQQFGFRSRQAQHQFLVATGGLDEHDRRLILDPGAWYLTMGDSDLDAYAG